MENNIGEFTKKIYKTGDSLLLGSITETRHIGNRINNT